VGWRRVVSALLMQLDSERAPLLGNNLVRLLYLDEAGTDKNSPWMCVAGVLTHGDRQWPEIDARILALIDKYILEPDRDGFVFHATDIFHGSGYFRRERWPIEVRLAILADMAGIIGDLKLPVAWSTYHKDMFGVGAFGSGDRPDFKPNMLHYTALLNCLVWADKWLAANAPDELATVVHEDGTPAKNFVKDSLRILRSVSQMRSRGLSEATRIALGLPLKRIIDTVHFAEKPDARPLQLADLCAFALGRAAKDNPVPTEVLTPIITNVVWMA
jgi:Protein of unknown function (DUF3800)